MKKETIIKLKNEWKEMSNNSNKPDGVNTMLYLCLVKTEENFFKSYTGLKNEIKLKNTIYDYNYNVILYTNLIEMALNNYIKNRKYKV